MKASILICTLLCVFNNVETSKTNDQGTNITEIRFGTSFGQCSGYCIQEVVLKEGQVEKTLIPHRNKSLKPTKCTIDYTDFSGLSSKINIKEFDQLEVTIGCPDCNDGGAEWVQVITEDGFSKKVTYSFSDEPETITPYIAELRKLYEKMGECN